jgi:hypothetical protein
MTFDLNTLTLRQLQTESARVLAANGGYSSNELSKFNKIAHHDSHLWYKAVINWYIGQYGDLPSKVGPGSTVKLLLDN